MERNLNGWELSTGYPQDDLEDLLEVPEFFEDHGVRDGVGYTVRRQPSAPVNDDLTTPLPSPWTTAPLSSLRLITKPGVRILVRPEMLEALNIADARRDVITSANDGQHVPRSLHPEGLAIDVRPAADLQAQVFRYRNAGYKVLTEGLKDPSTGRYIQITKDYGTGAHLHISFDPEGKRV